MYITYKWEIVVNMLIGEYHHTLDDKKRISLPSKFRKELGRVVVITYGLDKCLFVYPMKQWKEVAEKIAAPSIGQVNARDFNRFMFSGAVETAVDNIGRILIPDFLKSHAGLKVNAVVAGVYSRVEIWDEDNWGTYKRSIQEKADGLAQQLSDVGAI